MPLNNTGRAGLVEYRPPRWSTTIRCTGAACQQTAPEAAERLRLERSYFTDNAPRMRYPGFCQRGLMLDSSVAKAASRALGVDSTY